MSRSSSACGHSSVASAPSSGSSRATPPLQILEPGRAVRPREDGTASPEADTDNLLVQCRVAATPTSVPWRGAAGWISTGERAYPRHESGIRRCPPRGGGVPFLSPKCCYTGDPAGSGPGSSKHAHLSVSMPSRSSVKTWARSSLPWASSSSCWRLRIPSNWGPVS